MILNLAKSKYFDGSISFSNTLASSNGEALLRQYLRTYTHSKIALIEDEMVGSSSVMLDNYHSSQLILNHLFEHGLRRFAYISGPLGTRDASERFSGVKDYLKEKNIELEDFFEGNFTYEFGEKVIRSYFDKGKSLPEAFVCANNEMAVGAYHALMSYGIKVPQDVKLVGFDDTDQGKLLESPLTTINQPFLEMLMEGLDTIRNKTIRKVMFPGELIGKYCKGIMSLCNLW